MEELVKLLLPKVLPIVNNSMKNVQKNNSELIALHLVLEVYVKNATLETT